jgi:hypothetical protein
MSRWVSGSILIDWLKGLMNCIGECRRVWARMSVKVHRFMAHRYAILEAYLPRFDRISGRIECMMVFDAGVRCEMDGREDGGWKDEGMQQARPRD